MTNDGMLIFLSWWIGISGCCWADIVLLYIVAGRDNTEHPITQACPVRRKRLQTRGQDLLRAESKLHSTRLQDSRHMRSSIMDVIGFNSKKLPAESNSPLFNPPLQRHLQEPPSLWWDNCMQQALSVKIWIDQLQIKWPFYVKKSMCVITQWDMRVSSWVVIQLMMTVCVIVAAVCHLLQPPNVY